MDAALQRGASPGGEPEEREDPRVARTRQAVHAAVHELLRRSGIESVTHQRVAEAAGVGRASVYRHWPARTDLILDALAARPPVTEWRTSGDVARDLRTELGRIREVLEESALLPQIVALIGRAEWEPELRELKLQLVDHASRPLRAALVAAVGRHDLPESIDFGLALARLAGPLFFRKLVTDEAVDDAFVDAVVDAFLGEGR